MKQITVQTDKASHRFSFITMATAILVLLLFSMRAYALPLDGEDGKKTKSFNVSKGGELEVTISGGDIRLTTWDKDEVLVVVEGLDDEDLDDVKMTQSGNSIRVDYRPRWNWSGDAVFRISLPAQFDADVRTSGGEIDVKGTIKGKLTGATSGGDVRTGNIEGTASLKTSGGDIKLGDVTGEAEVRTSGGEIKVQRVGKSLRASTAGGDVEVGDVGGDAVLSTAGGDVKVGKVSGSATLKTAGGGIELRSASGRVEASTAGGDIRLEDITGSIRAKTAGGDVNAELIPSGKGNSELRSSGGNIVLAVPADAKATIDATIRIRGEWGSRSFFRGRSKKERAELEEEMKNSMEHSKYDIRSDFKEETKDIRGDEQEIHAFYKLNGGGDTISLETTNGNIEIRKMAKK